MTGIRQSFAFCRERDGFGTGKADTANSNYNFVHVAAGGANLNTFVPLQNQRSSDYWIAPPPGSYFSHTSTRTVKRIQTTGSKFWDAQAYGQVQGTWEWSFVLDPEYIEPLFFAFEETVLSNLSLNTVDDMAYQGIFGYNYIMRNYYKFKKANNTRVRSFVVKLVVDNRMVKGGYNVIKILKGCVVKDIKFTKGADSSVINVDMSGFYVDEQIEYASGNPATIYKEPVNSPSHFEWMASYLKKKDSTIAYLADVSTVSISVGNSSQAVYSVASPFAANYSEGQTSISMSMTAYYTDPLQYRTLLSNLVSNKYRPAAKGIQPMNRVLFLTSSLNANSLTKFPGVYPGEFSTENENYPSISQYVEGFGASNNRKFVWFDLEGVAIKSFVWDKGDGGSPLQDKISGNDCRTIAVCIADYGSTYNTSGMFDKILTMGDPTYSESPMTVTNPLGESKTDSFEIGTDIGSIASADKIYGLNGVGQDKFTRDYKNLDGWFAPYYYDNIPVIATGYRWEQTGTDEEDNPIYSWVEQETTGEYSNLHASAWLYSSHFVDTFTEPGRSLGVSPGMGDSALNLDREVIDLDYRQERSVDESLINTDDENKGI